MIPVLTWLHQVILPGLFLSLLRTPAADEKACAVGGSSALSLNPLQSLSNSYSSSAPPARSCPTCNGLCTLPTMQVLDSVQAIMLASQMLPPWTPSATAVHPQHIQHFVTRSGHCNLLDVQVQAVVLASHKQAPLDSPINSRSSSRHPALSPPTCRSDRPSQYIQHSHAGHVTMLNMQVLDSAQAVILASGTLAPLDPSATAAYPQHIKHVLTRT